MVHIRGAVAGSSSCGNKVELVMEPAVNTGCSVDTSRGLDETGVAVGTWVGIVGDTVGEGIEVKAVPGNAEGSWFEIVGDTVAGSEGSWFEIVGESANTEGPGAEMKVTGDGVGASSGVPGVGVQHSSFTASTRMAQVSALVPPQKPVLPR